MKRGALVAGAAAVATAVSACGASSSSLGPVHTQAARVCSSAAGEMARIAPPPDASGAVAFLRHGVSVLASELAALRKLGSPRGHAGAYSAALDALDREQTTLRTTIAGLNRGADPVSAMKTLQAKLSSVESDADDAWRKLQLPACVAR